MSLIRTGCLNVFMSPQMFAVGVIIAIPIQTNGETKTCMILNMAL